MKTLSAIGYRLSARRDARSSTPSMMLRREKDAQCSSGHRRSISPMADGRRPTAALAFTLVELLIAVIVLLAVILALSRIFTTATDVTGIGQATATVMQEAAVIEQRMREDIAKLSPDGIFAIRQVAVANDVHGDDQLLDPTKPPDYIFRADQLVFFADGVASQQTLRFGSGAAASGQSTTARVYWGHAFQLPDGDRYNPDTNRMFDPRDTLTPWHRGPAEMVGTLIQPVSEAGGSAGTSIYGRVDAGVIDGTQPPPSRWLLARQPVILLDDDDFNPNENAKTVFMMQNQTARSIFLDESYGGGPHPVFGWSREIRNGRMDGAASMLNEIRRWIRTWPDATETPRTWNEQRNIIASEVLYYPRAERRPPSMHRVDQALSNHIIGSAVSNFIIEWTWDDGTGDLYDEGGRRLFYRTSTDAGEILNEDRLNPAITTRPFGVWRPFGFYTNALHPSQGPYEFQPEQPWFGLNLPDRGVGIYGQDLGQAGSYQAFANYHPARSAFPNLVDDDPDDSVIERWGTGGAPFAVWPFNQYGDSIELYEAFFGYNRTMPVLETPRGIGDLNHNTVDGLITPELGYTPWPSAIRVTMTLHDPQGRLEEGRTFQFVIDLPKRVHGGRK